MAMIKLNEKQLQLTKHAAHILRRKAMFGDIKEEELQLTLQDYFEEMIRHMDAPEEQKAEA